MTQQFEKAIAIDVKNIRVKRLGNVDKSSVIKIQKF